MHFGEPDIKRPSYRKNIMGVDPNPMYGEVKKILATNFDNTELDRSFTHAQTDSGDYVFRSAQNLLIAPNGDKVPAELFCSPKGRTLLASNPRLLKEVVLGTQEEYFNSTNLNPFTEACESNESRLYTTMLQPGRNQPKQKYVLKFRHPVHSTTSSGKDIVIFTSGTSQFNRAREMEHSPHNPGFQFLVPEAATLFLTLTPLLSEHIELEKLEYFLALENQRDSSWQQEILFLQDSGRLTPEAASSLINTINSYRQKCSTYIDKNFFSTLFEFWAAGRKKFAFDVYDGYKIPNPRPNEMLFSPGDIQLSKNCMVSISGLAQIIAMHTGLNALSSPLYNKGNGKTNEDQNSKKRIINGSLMFIEPGLDCYYPQKEQIINKISDFDRLKLGLKRKAF